jgi:hypothetical protein
MSPDRSAHGILSADSWLCLSCRRTRLEGRSLAKGTAEFTEKIEHIRQHLAIGPQPAIRKHVELRSMRWTKSASLARQEWIDLTQEQTSVGGCLSMRLKQRSSPGTCRQKSSEENDGVDAGSSLGRPVDVAQVQPESEFVERERGAYAVENRHQPAEKNRRLVFSGGYRLAIRSRREEG